MERAREGCEEREVVLLYPGDFAVRGSDNNYFKLNFNFSKIDSKISVKFLKKSLIHRLDLSKNGSEARHFSSPRFSLGSTRKTSKGNFCPDVCPLFETGRALGVNF